MVSTGVRSGVDRSESLRVGILGVGNIGKVHLQSAATMDGVRVAAAADAEARNRAYATREGVPAVYGDYDELFGAESLDVAVVALPPFLHADAVEAAAERGCDVFVEKPLARTVEEAQHLLDVADAAGIRVGVDHTLRYFPQVRRVREAYRDGRIGDVPFATIARVNNGPFDRPPASTAPPEWHLDADATGGGVLVELGVHLFDVLEWTFGDMRVVGAATDRQLSVPVEDSATVLLASEETGTRATLHCGSYQWEEPSEFNMTLRLEGVTGTIDSGDYEPANFYANAAKSGVKNVVNRLTGSDPQYYGPTYYLRGYFGALADFFEAVRADETPPVSGEDGLRSLELTTAAYEAASEPDDELEVIQ